MAESDFAEKLNTEDAPVTDVMTGDRDKRMYLYYQLVRSIRQAKQIDIMIRRSKANAFHHKFAP